MTAKAVTGGKHVENTKASISMQVLYLFLNHLGLVLRSRSMHGNQM